MEAWVYKTGITGSLALTVSEISGKPINGRIYRSGFEYRPAQNEDGIPVGKEFSYNISLGRISFAFPFDEDENIDIPYEEN